MIKGGGVFSRCICPPRSPSRVRVLVANELALIVVNHDCTHARRRNTEMPALALLATAALLAGNVKQLTPDNWHANVKDGTRWMVYFAVQGCKHCEKLAPMMEMLSNSEQALLEGLRVGKVDATLHNGIARTFRAQRFPTILFISGDTYWEFSDRRSIPGMLEFSRNPPPGGYFTPTELQANVSDYWLMAEALWPPLKMALSWSVGIALGIKLLSLGCLRLLERQSKKAKEDRAQRKTAAKAAEAAGGDSANAHAATTSDKKGR